MPDRFDGLIRVSRVAGRGGESFISPAVQRQQIEAWAAMRGARIVTWHEDLDQSGSRADRPGLTLALERIEAGQSDGIVVAKLDRFFRNLPLALEAIKRVDKAGGQVIAVADGVDPGTPIGRMMRQFLLSIAEWQFAVAQEQWLVARERAVARGVHIASRVPTGYVRDDDTGRLAPHPHDGPAIREVFEARAAGGSWTELCVLLDERGVVGPYRAEQWTTRAMQHIIANRVYLGEARSGEFTNPAAHDPLVDRGTWEAAQRARGAPAQRSPDPALLAGLLRCAGCRYALKPDRMRDRDGTVIRMYRCRGQHASGSCPARVSVLARVIEPWVERRFLAEVGALEARQAEHDDETRAARREVEQAEAELAAFRDDERIVGALGPDRFVEGLRRRATAVDEAFARLADAREREQPSGAPPIHELRALWPELDVGEKQRALRAVIDVVFLRGRVKGRHLPIDERALILWRGDAPDDLPRRGFRPPLRPFLWPDDLPVSAGVAIAEDAAEGPAES